MNMKKFYIIILLILITILLIILGLYLGNMFANKIDVDMSKVEIDNTEPTNEVYNPIKTNEISKYIPNNITDIILINYMSDLANPTTYYITEIEQIEKFMNLFTKTHWNERQDAKYDTFDDALWEIHIVGEFECLLKMQGIGGLNSQNGVVQIEAKDDIKDYYISREIYMEILAFTNEKYYLHDSKLEIPSQEKCYAAQEKALEGLTEDAKKNLQKNIRYIHIKLENELLDAVRLIKDKNSPYWEDFTSYEAFTDPFTGTGVINGGRFLYVLDELGKIKDISINEKIKQDLQKAYNTLKEGMDEHNLKKCFEAHKIIHDYDYFVINTPVHLEFPPADWGGVTNYFGLASVLE